MTRKRKGRKGRSPGKRGPTPRRKRAGSAYERVVADVARAMDPAATVRQGEWVTGPDGARELDVVVTGTADGQERTILIECKDYDPGGTGPVGIEHVDALDSKRRDLGVDAALLCSNAGFTDPAIRKASRVGIGLIGVMKQGDARIRFHIAESLYYRHIALKGLSIGLHHGGSQLDLREVPPEAILYEGLSVLNWAHKRAGMILAANPLVKGRLSVTNALKEPITVELPTGPGTVDQIDFHVELTGGWFVQDITYDASAGLYDWLRKRVRLAPGPGQVHLKLRGPIPGGDPVRRPPEYVLTLYEGLPGEVAMSLTYVEGVPAGDPAAPEIDPLIEPADLDLVIKDLPSEYYTSAGFPTETGS